MRASIAGIAWSACMTADCQGSAIPLTPNPSPRAPSASQCGSSAPRWGRQPSSSTTRSNPNRSPHLPRFGQTHRALGHQLALLAVSALGRPDQQHGRAPVAVCQGAVDESPHLPAVGGLIAERQRDLECGRGVGSDVLAQQQGLRQASRVGSTSGTRPHSCQRCSLRFAPHATAG
jgi:hypothetical protein